MAEADGAAAAARETRRWLERLLDAEPFVADSLPADFAERTQVYVERLLKAYVSNRTSPEETFLSFARRHDGETLRKLADAEASS